MDRPEDFTAEEMQEALDHANAKFLGFGQEEMVKEEVFELDELLM